MAKGDAGGMPGGGGATSTMGKIGSGMNTIGDAWDNSKYDTPNPVQMPNAAGGQPQNNEMQGLVSLIQKLFQHKRPEDEIVPLGQLGNPNQYGRQNPD